MSLFGLDLYYNNTVPSVDQLLSVGVKFVIHKAFEYYASYSIDPAYNQRKAEYMSAGLKFGAYCFGNGLDGKVQANAFLKAVNPDGSFVLSLDLEAYMGRAQANDFCKRVYLSTGKWPLLYGGKDYLTGLGFANSDEAAQCPLWFAGTPRADGTPDLPSPWTKQVLWQRPPSAIFGLDTDYVDTDDAGLIALWSSLSGVYKPASVVPIRLDVPYTSQWKDEESATKYQYRDDCGIAALAMILDFYGLSHDDIGTMGSMTTLARSDVGLYPSQLIPLAETYKLTFFLNNWTPLDTIEASLRSGTPIIALVNLDPLKGLSLPRPIQDPTAQIHYWVITGYDGNFWYVNDPDFWGSREQDGKDFPIPASVMYDCLNQLATGGQILTPQPVSIPPVTVPPSGGSDVTRYVNTPPDASGNASHLIVHDLPQSGQASWAHNSDGSVAELADQTAVKVLAQTTGAFSQIASDNLLYPGKWLMSSYLSETLRSASPPSELTLYVDTIGSHLIVHDLPQSGQTTWSKRADGSVIQLDDQTGVKVLAAQTNGFYQIASDDPSGLAGKWLMAAFLSQTLRTPHVPVPVTPSGRKAYPATSILGEYYIPGGGSEWWAADAKTLQAQDVPLSVVVFGRQLWPSELTPSAMRPFLPNTIFVDRIIRKEPGVDWTRPDLRQYGRDCVAAYVKLPLDHAADYQYLFNELDGGTAQQNCDLWNGVMDGFEAVGMKACILNSPYFHPLLPGEPPGSGNDDPSFWTQDCVHQLCRRVRDEDHVLSVHHYLYPDKPGSAWDGGPMARVEQYTALLPADIQDVPWIITEHGTGYAPQFSDADLIAGRHAAETLFRNGIAYILGTGEWVDCNYGEWTESDLGRHRAAILADRLKSRW